LSVKSLPIVYRQLEVT